MQFELLTFPCGFQHTINPDDDERNGEQLAHIEQHVGLPSLLHVLGVFDEETEREDIEEAESEIPARAHLWVLGVGCWVLGVGGWIFSASLVNGPHDEEQDGIGNGLVELAGMARKIIYAFEDKGPHALCHALS